MSLVGTFGLEVGIIETVEKKEFTIEDIRFNGTGGTDVCGEWSWSGNYDMKLSRNWTTYKFYSTIYRRRSRNGNTIGWGVSLYLTMYYSNGRDIKLLEKEFKTLKSAKQGIFEKIQEIHQDEAGTKRLIEEWKKNHALPVFSHDEETGKIILLGTTYISISEEMDGREESLWFNDDIPDYKNHRTFYDLNVSWHKPARFYASKTERTWGGYCGSSEHDPLILEQMVKLVENNKKYAWLFEKLESYKEREEQSNLQGKK